MKLEEKILALRKKKGLSQEGLAKRLKVTRQAVYKWEAGMSRPELDKILSIAQLFHVSSDVLLNDKLSLDIDSISLDEEEKQNENIEEEIEPSNNEENTINESNTKSKRKLAIVVICSIVVLAIIIIISVIIANNINGHSSNSQNISDSTQSTGKDENVGGLIPDTQICNHSYKLDSFADANHTKKCETCGDNLVENHVWNDGVCTYCEYYPQGYSKGLEFEMIDGVEAYALISLGTNKESHVKIPPTYNGLPVIRINSYTFNDCSRVTEITLPVSVKYMENSALLGAGNEEYDYSGYSFPRLKLYYEGTLTDWMNMSLGQHSNTGQTALYINGERVEDLVIPDDITEIRSNIFNFCIFDSVTIGSHVKKIGSNAFYFSDIHKLTIEEGLEEISSSAFYGVTDFSELTLPNTLKKIGKFAFFGTKISLLTIPDSVEYLGSNAFASCDKLLVVNMGSGLCYVGSQVFNSCDSIQIINFSTDGTWDIYNGDNNKIGTISGEKLSDKPYYYFIWQTPDYIHIKQGYEY
ncbi:MAG: leucine-rich repeat protein [Clostridia bacterium]|nr:leucine-rich repeat protein [Clostridia bacterium]